MGSRHPASLVLRRRPAVSVAHVVRPGRTRLLWVETPANPMWDITDLAAVTAELKRVNETLWQVEDDVRLCERNQDFGPRFVELARSVYQNNDRRAALKRRINELAGSALVEEKGYGDGQTNQAVDEVFRMAQKGAADEAQME